jgi:hypothetical protein
MADIDPVRIADPTEFQTNECTDGVPARDTNSDQAAPTGLSRRCVSSQDLPRFSRTSLQ